MYGRAVEVISPNLAMFRQRLIPHRRLTSDVRLNMLSGNAASMLQKLSPTNVFTCHGPSQPRLRPGAASNCPPDALTES